MTLPKVVYVAGPFRCASTHAPGQQDHWGIHHNIMNAMAYALEIWRMGAAAVCPHGNTFCFQNAAPDDVWLTGDLAILRKCDAVYMLPTWQQSSGARAERDFAVNEGVPVFYDLGELGAWLKEGV